MRSDQRSNNTAKNFLAYDTIELKQYMEIASTGEYEKLQIKGEVDVRECIERWEQIVLENSKAAGNGEYRGFVDLHKSYERLRAEHIIVSALLIKFVYGSKDHKKEVYELLKKRGYRLNITKDLPALDQSVTTAIKQCQHLLTKAKSKKNEIERDSSNKRNERGEQRTFISVMAELRMAIAPTIIGDNIKLIEYNEYVKILKRQQAANRKHNGRVQSR